MARSSVLQGEPSAGDSCKQCGRALGEDRAILAGGAHRPYEPGRSQIFEAGDALGFVSLVWETGNVAGAYLPVVDETPSGQFEIHFCSTACVRAFFGACVDELEARIRKEGFTPRC